MTQIEKMVREHGTGGWQTFNDMVRFARKVAMAEREKCMEAARAWVGDTDAAVNVDMYIKASRERDDV